MQTLWTFATWWRHFKTKIVRFQNTQLINSQYQQLPLLLLCYDFCLMVVFPGDPAHQQKHYIHSSILRPLSHVMFSISLVPIFCAVATGWSGLCVPCKQQSRKLKLLILNRDNGRLYLSFVNWSTDHWEGIDVCIAPHQYTTSMGQFW